MFSRCIGHGSPDVLLPFDGFIGEQSPDRRRDRLLEFGVGFGRCPFKCDGQPLAADTGESRFRERLLKHGHISQAEWPRDTWWGRWSLELLPHRVHRHSDQGNSGWWTPDGRGQPPIGRH